MPKRPNQAPTGLRRQRLSAWTRAPKPLSHAQVAEAARYTAIAEEQVNLFDSIAWTRVPKPLPHAQVAETARLNAIAGEQYNLYGSNSWTQAPMLELNRAQLTEAARQALLEGLEIAIRIGSYLSQVWAGWLLTDLLGWLGEYELALQHGRAALETALPLEELIPALVVPPLAALGLIYLELSEQFADQISEFHQHALRLLESPTVSMVGGTAWTDLGFCAQALGNLSLAGEVFDKGLHVPTMFTLVEKPRLLAGAAQLACAQGNLEHALSLAEEAHCYATERRMRHVLPLIQFSLGKIQMARGEIDAGLQAFQNAESAAQSQGMRPLIWQAQAAAGEALAAIGQEKPSLEKRTAAQAIVIEIADQIGDANLRLVYRRSALAKIWG